MKPVLCKKAGYSSRDIFVTLIKCLVLTWAFFLMGINLNQKKVVAANSEDVYIDSQNLGASEGVSLTCTVTGPDEWYVTSPVRWGCQTATASITATK